MKMMRNANQTMPAELAKALLEDGEKEAKESFEGVPSLVIAAKEDSGDGESGSVDELSNVNSLAESTTQSNHLDMENKPSIEDKQSTEINPPSSNNPPIETNSSPQSLSDNSDLFF